MRYLVSMDEPMLALDTRADFDLSPLESQFAEVNFAAGSLPKSWKKNITRIVLSPGIARSEPWIRELEEQGIEVIGDIELFARAASQPIISITGSNGKSTVTTLTAEFLAQAGYQVGMGGNIGCPALDLLLDEKDYDVYVLELSSFQLETTYSLHSASSVVLNISEDHMDRYPSLDAYLQAKLKIYDDTELAVIPYAERSESWVSTKTKKTGFDLTPPRTPKDYGIIEIDHQAWLALGEKPLVKLADMRLNAPHSQLNALAAMALCQDFDIAPSVFSQVLEGFNGLAHRTQRVVEHQGVRWIDDSKGTNVGATLTAIHSLGQQAQQQEGKLILLLGGVGKEADFSPLAPAINQYVKQVVLFGRDQTLICQAIAPALRLAIKLDCVDNLQQAIAISKQGAKPGDVVLFSPACASFDQFANYHDRGEKFNLWVHQALGIACASV